MQLLRVAVVLSAVLAAAAVRYDLVPTYEVGEITFEEFLERHVKTRTPCVVKGFMSGVFDHKFAPGEAFDFVAETCRGAPLEGSCKKPDDDEVYLNEEHGVRQPNPDLLGKAWGGLAVSNLTLENVSTVDELIELQRLRRNTDETQLYLHDHSIDSLCPELLETFQIPKWFAWDFYSWMEFHQFLGCPRGGQFPGLSPPGVGDIRPFHLRNREQMTLHQWPSLFLGPNNTASSLHTDSSATHFWMVVVEGTKFWRMFPLDQIPNLYPQRVREHPSVEMKIYDNFAVDVFNPDYEKYPKLRDAWGWEQNLTRGDTIYIPGSTPHAVKNVGDTVSYSYNMVDKANLEDHLEADFLYKEGSHPYSDVQKWFLRFLAENITLPKPTKESETLGEYYARNHPLNFMKKPANRRAWANTGINMSFEEWFDLDPFGEQPCRDLLYQCPYWARIGHCGSGWMFKHCAASCKACGTCRDLHQYCDTWAENGECRNNAWMRENCRYSCGSCCEDTDDYCPKWAERGECESNSIWMGKNCAYSCGTCEPPCTDHHMHCTSWADRGECQGENEKWMAQWCPVSCDTCNENCADEHTLCSSWAKMGECAKNPEFMTTACCVSCSAVNKPDSSGSASSDVPAPELDANRASAFAW